MDQSIKYCSIYSEKSLENLPFKDSTTYEIDWTKLVDISKNHGLISMIEFTAKDTKYKISYWSSEDSYARWSGDPYIQQFYLKARDQYNKENHILQNLILGQVNKVL